MPNHCYQSVEVRGPRAMVRYLYEELTENKRFCDVVIPIPLESVADSYNWCWDNWGVKWDVAEVEITNDLQTIGVERDGDAWFSFRCWTAWGPPVPVWERLHALGLEVHAEYQDEAMLFAGEFSDGENFSWDPADEEEVGQ